jgi:hypothetical protein
LMGGAATTSPTVVAVDCQAATAAIAAASFNHPIWGNLVSPNLNYIAVKYETVSHDLDFYILAAFGKFSPCATSRLSVFLIYGIVL